MAFWDKQSVFYILLSLLLLLPAKILAGNDNLARVQHQAPAMVERDKPVNLSFDVPAVNMNNVQDAFLFYKYDGEASFRQKRAEYTASGYEVQFNINNRDAGSLIYYFAVELTNGQTVTYPTSRPEADPIRVDIVERQARHQQAQNIEYTILSPDPGSATPASDVMVAITLFYEEGAIDTTTSSLRLMLDDRDVTDEAEASDYFFSYSPENVAPGEHSAALLLTMPKDTLEIARWQFGVLDPDQPLGLASSSELGMTSEEETNMLIPQGQVELSAQNQEMGGISNDVLKGNVRLSGRNENIRYSVNGLLTSQEDPRLQPQNRYGAELYVGDWLEIQGGHIYPSLSQLSISGRRVNGVNAAVHAFGGAVNAQFLHGRINRSVSNIYHNQIRIDSVMSNGQLVDKTYSLGFSSDGIGTFKRNVTGGRLSFGRGETFQWGLNFLKVRDDTTSLTTIYDFQDLQRQRSDLLSSLDQESRTDLQNNPDLLSVNGNTRPKDNIVAGSDLIFSLFDDALRFRSETAVSMLNEDISPGVLSDDNALDINIDEDLTSDLERWSWLFILNENISVLPVRYSVDAEQTEIDDVFFPTSILANESELNVNLSDNSLRVQYRWIGPEYSSLANSTIRRDIAGFTVSDRFQLFQNRLYVTLGYEDLHDNVSNTKSATTDTRTARANVSWYPVDQYMPRVSVGYMYRNRDNGVMLNNPYVANIGDPETRAVRNFAIAGGDTVLSSNPRLTNTSQITTSVSQQFNLFSMSHNASINYSYLNTKDDFFEYGDTKSSSVNFSLESRFNALPLNTRIGLNINNTETLGGLSDMNILGFNVGGRLVLLDEKLNVNANFTLTQNDMESAQLAIDDNGTEDSRDDIYQAGSATQQTENNLFVMRGGAQYDINDSHSVIVNFSFTNVQNQLSSLNSPNDHSLQARYVFRF